MKEYSCLFRFLLNINRRSLFCAFVAVVFLFINIYTPVAAAQSGGISEEQKSLLRNNIRYFDLEGCAAVESASEVDPSSGLDGSDNAEKVFNYMVDADYTEEQAAGFVGNFAQESKLDPKAVNPDSGAYGLAQWLGSRKNNLEAFAERKNKPKDSLGLQLEFVVHELNGDEGAAKSAIKAVRGSGSNAIEEVTVVIRVKYERPGEAEANDANRIARAKAAYREFGGGDRGSSDTVTASSDSVASGTQCTCDPSSVGSSGGKTVVLDPGHSGSTVNETDPESGIKAQDSDNGQETKDVWAVSEIVRKKLERKGYKVISTKKSEQDAVGLIARAKIANDAKADIAVSIHNTPGRFGSEVAGWVTPQEVGLYRQTGSHKKVFEDENIAKKSKEYSDAAVAERKKIEDGVQIHRLNFEGRGLPATGNIAIVQLFAKVPWIYHEVGQSGFDKDKYAEGITNGITKALGDPGGRGESSSSNSSEGSTSDCETPGDFEGTLKAYAWPDYHAAPYLQRREAYAQAVKEADENGIFRGGTVNGVDGIDCGGFVTLLMLNSGFEPKYNFSGKISEGASNTTGGQIPWLENNWQKINPKDTKDLQPGDVAINSGHTYVYVGKIDGFNSVTASSSYSTSGNGRAPMAGHEAAADPAYNWYRKK